MDDVTAALLQLDEARSRHKLALLPKGLRESQIVDLLTSAGVYPHEHLVAWYAHYGPAPHVPLVPGVFVDALHAEVDEYLKLQEIVEGGRDQSDAVRMQTTDWFPIGREQNSLTVMWARDCVGSPAVASQNELGALEPTPTGDPVTLPELLTTWVTRLDLGYYTPAKDGTIPWFEYKTTQIDGRRQYHWLLSDDVRRRAGL